MKILYFAWVREKIGKDHDIFNLPQDVDTVAKLIDWLKEKGPEYRLAFEKADIIRCALDQHHVKHAASLKGVSEIAFFPPVTGG